MDKEIRAITRPHRLKLGIHHIFRHSIYVRNCAFAVSMETGISDFHTVCQHLYGKMREPYVRASITQAAIRDGVAAANSYRTALKNHAGKPPSEPEFSRPVLKLNNQSWRLNKIAEGYVAKANVGSRESPCVIIINVGRSVAKRIEMYDLGELWITGDTYTITYSRKVPSVRRPVPYGKSEIIELAADVGRVPGPPKNILAVDLNAGNITAGDGHTMVQFDLSGMVDDTVEAKTRAAEDTAYDRMHDNVSYKRRTGRDVSHENEEERLARRKVLHGGPKLHKKLKRKWNKLKRDGKREEAARVKERMDMCVLDATRDHKKSRRDSKKDGAAKKSRSYECAIHVAALLIATWALKTDSLLVLENLRGMFEGWSKKKGKFGRGARRKIYSAAIMKMSGIIYDKARLLGVEAVRMNPYHTSKLCAACRHVLSGGYRLRTCRHCMVGVDRDVNAVDNMRRTSAAARYGPQVRACLGEARRVADVILDPASLAHGRWSGWADRLAAAVF